MGLFEIVPQIDKCINPLIMNMLLTGVQKNTEPIQRRNQKQRRSYETNPEHRPDPKELPSS